MKKKEFVKGICKYGSSCMRMWVRVLIRMIWNNDFFFGGFFFVCALRR